MKNLSQRSLLVCLLVFWSALFSVGGSVPVFAEKKPALEAVKFTSLPDGKLKITLNFSQPLKRLPKSFTTTRPKKIIFDFEQVKNLLTSGETKQIINQGVLDRFLVLDAANRTRVILDVRKMVSYNVNMQNNRVEILLSGGVVNNRHKSAQRFGMPIYRFRHQVEHVDFRAMKDKGGKVIIQLSDDGVAVDIQKKGDLLYVNFPYTQLPQRLMERLDVRDFGSPVKYVDAALRGSTASFVIRLRGPYEHFSYQVDRKFVIEVVHRQQVDWKPELKAAYSSKLISMNFQDIKVRAALQLLADTSKHNIVVSDAVQGTVTLRLNRVPWNQALDIILKTRGLGKRVHGDVIIVAPIEEIAAQEKQELLSQQAVQNLAPMTQDLIQIKYAKAGALANLLKDKNNSLLSDRGRVSVDDRTNSLWIQDTAYQIADVKRLLEKLDRPVRQVLIETRIVIVDKDFERDLGVRFGASRPNHFSGTLEGANRMAGNTVPSEVPISERLNVDLPSTAKNATSVALALARLSNGTLLDLELSALESEGSGQVISTPRVITADQQEALIEAGEEIPYQESTSSGATSIAFKKAVLSLRVKPQITPDNKLVLDLTVNQDNVSNRKVNNVPAIETKEIQTHVLVENGETIVLGGIYKQTKQAMIERVPFLGRIPVIGILFKRHKSVDNRDELLIFVTPKIVNNNYTPHHA